MRNGCVRLVDLVSVSSVKARYLYTVLLNKFKVVEKLPSFTTPSARFFLSFFHCELPVFQPVKIGVLPTINIVYKNNNDIKLNFINNWRISE